MSSFYKRCNLINRSRKRNCWREIKGKKSTKIPGSVDKFVVIMLNVAKDNGLNYTADNF